MEIAVVKVVARSGSGSGSGSGNGSGSGKHSGSAVSQQRVSYLWRW